MSNYNAVIASRHAAKLAICQAEQRGNGTATQAPVPSPLGWVMVGSDLGAELRVGVLLLVDGVGLAVVVVVEVADYRVDSAVAAGAALLADVVSV